jgi:hypothetical protein
MALSSSRTGRNFLEYTILSSSRTGRTFQAPHAPPSPLKRPTGQPCPGSLPGPERGPAPGSQPEHALQLAELALHGPVEAPRRARVRRPGRPRQPLAWPRLAAAGPAGPRAVGAMRRGRAGRERARVVALLGRRGNFRLQRRESLKSADGECRPRGNVRLRRLRGNVRLRRGAAGCDNNSITKPNLIALKYSLSIRMP